MSFNRIGFWLTLAFFLIDFGQLHQMVPGVNYLRLGFVTQTLLLFAVPAAMAGGTRWMGPVVAWRSAFFLAILLCGLFSMNTGMSRLVINSGFFRLVCGFLAMCVFMRSLDDLKLIRYVLIFLALATSLWVLTHGGHGPGMLIDENDAAMGMIVLLPFTFFFISAEKNIYIKAVSLAAFFITLLAIASTVSRGGMVGTLPSLVFLWLKSKHKLASLLLILALLTITVLLGPADLIAQFETIDDPNESTAASRLFFWGLSTQLFLARPIIGVGPGSWETAIWSGLIPTPESVSNRTPHSLYFQLLSEMGLVGVIAWLGLLVSIIMCLRSLNQKRLGRDSILMIESMKQRPLEVARIIDDKKFVSTFANALSISLLGFLLASAFLSVLFYPQFFMIAALAHVLKRTWEVEISAVLYLARPRVAAS